MKKKLLLNSFILFLVFSLFTFEIFSVITPQEYNGLTQEELSGLLLMREEEKLARDVYMKLFEIWNIDIFYNIANSEEKHTSSVKNLLDKYQIEDPMEVDIQGVFKDEDLQNLYDSLIEQGSSSLLNALIVGATIEDLDIYDLQELKKLTDKEDIITVYNNLEKGSRNHIRSFIKLIEQNGGVYSANYISDEELNLILNSEIERGKFEDNWKETPIIEKKIEQNLIQNILNWFKNFFN